MKVAYTSCLSACVSDIQTISDVLQTAAPTSHANLVGSLCVMLVGHWEEYARSCLSIFSTSRHPVFASYISKPLDRMNARIKVAQIKEDFINRFGGNYRMRLDRLVARSDALTLAKFKIPSSQAYVNIIEWRHTFVHSRKSFPPVSIDDVRQSFLSGSGILRCYMLALS